MRPPKPPFLELQFYFATSPDSANMTRLVGALQDLGAKITGDVDAHRGIGIETRRFARVADEPLERMRLTPGEDLPMYLERPDVRPVRVYIEGASGTVRGVAEVITYLDVSPEAARADRHPLGIWTDGDVFSGLLRDEEAAQASKIGKRAYARFLAVIRATRPHYAAITSEENLPCLTDLRRESRSEAFRDFYVSSDCVGPSGLEQIRRFFDRAYVEPVAQGIYVSTMREFNPAGIGRNIEWSLQRSNDVAKVIAARSEV